MTKAELISSVAEQAGLKKVEAEKLAKAKKDEFIRAEKEKADKILKSRLSVFGEGSNKILGTESIGLKPVYTGFKSVVPASAAPKTVLSE